MRRAIPWLLCLCGGCGSAKPPPPLADDHPDAAAVRATMLRFLSAHRSGRIEGQDYRNMLTGEAQTRLTKAIGGLAAEPDVVRKANEGRAVARVRVHDETGDGELYFYLRHVESSWKVDALRGFALTGIYRWIISRARELPAGEEGAYQLANARMVVADDATLRNWFFAHRQELDTLADAARAKIAAGEWVTCSPTWKFHAELTTSLRRLALNAVFHRADGSVKVSIGGMADNDVGILQVRSGDPPLPMRLMDDENYIWSEPLGDGWFLYRTT